MAGTKDIGRRLAATVAIAGALAAAGCGAGASSPGATAGTASTATTDAVSQAPAPRPPTARERRFVASVRRYSSHFRRWFEGEGNVVITDAVMRRQIQLFDGCRGALRRGGAPGRYHAVRTQLARTCRRLDHAAAALRRALATSDNGSVLAGSADARRFSRALEASTGAAGNAYNDLQSLPSTIAAARAQMG